MDVKYLAGLYLAGVLLVALGLGFFDWRLAPIAVGVSVAVPVLMLKEKE